MTKRYDEPIEVTCDSVVPAAPLSFVWRGHRYDVDHHLKAWREGGEWWRQPRERDYHRVLARPAGALASGDLDADGFMASVGAVYDVYLDRLAGTWSLARVWD